MSDLPFLELLSPDWTAGSSKQEPANRRPRIALVLPTLDEPAQPAGWAARWGLGIGRELAKVGDWAVEVLSIGARSFEHLDDGLIRRVLPSATSIGDGPAEDRLSWEMSRVLSRTDAAIISQPFTRQAETAMVLARAFGRPVIAIDSGLRTSAVGASLGLFELIDGTICHSEFGASLLPPEAQPAVVLGGVDHLFFTPVGAGEAEDGTHARCLVVSVDQPDDDLVQSVAEELPRGGEIVVVTELPEQHRPGLERRRLGDCDKVMIEELSKLTMRQLRDLYRWADVTVVTSAKDGTRCYEMHQLNLMGLESMACGTPVVVDGAHSFSEYVLDGSNGVIVDCQGEIPATVGRLLQERTQREGLGRQARAAAVDRFGFDHVAPKVRDVLVPLLMDGSMK